ncbi:uncharacterized protein LOC132203191 isoform X2 [Neocloeon triangulifer]|uniref:uncharacterized protein LOC132203191 isoform X2 n=1 Tax=Neocloeon triangulifer TaxID=2078957 RepID=UPI00286F6121|nr:uncharacterized protein LOC132203191 isoform X2 [Neocloeon triangulifer]XP_059486760.1 uncharacterized protein LOC132203191 isoform X2 [Neocloeon triangulifer]
MGDQMSNQADPINWKRTGDIAQDQLYLYEHGYFYDCTFAIGADKKIFKCHKVVLARASNVLAAMMKEHFEDESRSRDDPIVKFSNTSAEAFEYTMRFIYGNDRTLRSVQVAIEVYRFAQECCLDMLQQVAADFMAKKCQPEEAITVYECFKSYGDDRPLDTVASVISQETFAVISSESWRHASVKTVEEILQLEHLNTTESGLFRALLNWAFAQKKTTLPENQKIVMASYGSNFFSDNENYRELIDKPLKLIRFRNFDAYEFLRSLAHSNNVLTEKEKLQILMNLGNGNQFPMPNGFTNVLRFRNLRPEKYSFSFHHLERVEDIELTKNCPMSLMSFQVNSAGFILTGVKLHSLSYANKGQVMDVSCRLIAGDALRSLVSVQFQGANTFGPQDVLSFPEHVPLKKGVLYILHTNYYNKETCKSRRFNYGKNLRCEDTDDYHFLSFKSCMDNSHDDISSLIMRRFM